MIHLGTSAGTLCGKPVARRWWFQWPPKPRFLQIGNLIARDEPDASEPDRHSDCEACVRAATRDTTEGR